MLMLVALVSTALAVSPVQPEGMRERVTAQVEAAKARLALTDAQREQATPIIRGGIERRMQILRKHQQEAKDALIEKARERGN